MNVEILVPTYNQAVFLEETLRSLGCVKGAEFSVWVSDDASTDGTHAVLERAKSENWLGTVPFRVTRRPSQSGNLFRHWNEMIRASRADYVALFHSDDLYESEILREQLALTQTYPDIDAVWTSGRAIDENGKLAWAIRPPSSVAGPILEGRSVYGATATGGNSFLICPSVLYRRSVFDRLGLFDESYKQSADLEMAFRILEKGKAALIDKPLIRVRYSKQQASHRYQSHNLEESDFFEVLRRYQDVFDPTHETSSARQRLEQLDVLHRSLVALGTRNLEPATALASLRRALGDVERLSGVSSFGMVDRVKVLLARYAVAPLGATALALPLSRWVLSVSDPRSNPLLRFGISVSRGLRRT